MVLADSHSSVNKQDCAICETIRPKITLRL